VYKQLAGIAKELKIPMAATNDVHYVLPDDAYAQDVLLAIQTKQEIDDPNRKLCLLDSPTYYLRSPQEMQKLFYEYPEAIENTLRIADMTNVEIPMDAFIFPKYHTPNGMEAGEYLRELSFRKAREKFGHDLSDEVKTRLEYELDIIIQKGYTTYFLVFYDIAQFCKQEDILIQARGSAVGSLVLYVTDVININPMTYRLPFERFLNPERPSSPDIDLDMEDVKRGKVIEFTKQRFGEDKVAQIVTFGRMEERTAVRDVGRAMGLPYSFVDRIAKLVPMGSQGRHAKIEKALEDIEELKSEYETNAQVRKLMDYAIRLQGTARHAGTHAAGVVVTDRPIVEYVPLMLDTKKEGIMTQFDMYSLDKNASDNALGLLKLDFLGLRNLSILQAARSLIRQHRGVDIDLAKIPFDDQKVYELLQSGETTGLFQVESSGFRQLARDLKPTNIEDIMAMVAMYRPGPMEQIPRFIECKTDRSKITYPHPDLEPVLKDTYGVLIYQEQAMEIPQVMAGYSLGRADILRRAIGKKKLSLMQEEKKAFVEGATKQGYGKKEAEDVFKYIETFASYGFNRSHSASYGIIVYQTAYLKVNYPVEYMTALLTCEAGNAEKVSMVLKECKRVGIDILKPSVNESQVDFSIETVDDTQAIRFGLAAVKNAGRAALSTIVDERNKNGVYRDFYDFCMRVDSSKVNKKVLESLIKVGALDMFGSRQAMLQVMPEYIHESTEQQKKRGMGQFGLFEQEASQDNFETKVMPDVQEFPKKMLLDWEKELLGFYLSEHPLEKELIALERYISHKLVDVGEEVIGNTVTICGVVSAMRRIMTKKDGKEMAFIKITDFSGSIEAIVFPKIFQNGVREITEDRIILVKGRIDNKDDKVLSCQSNERGTLLTVGVNEC